MNKNFFLLGIMVTLSLLCNVITPKATVIDKIVARVNGVNILQSDLELPRISKEGGFYTLQEAINEQLFFQKAIEQHLLPSELDIERQIVAFKMQNNMTDMSTIEFEEQLKQSGFTLKMYKEQLGRLIAVENVKRAEVSEKLVVTSQEVEEYFKSHPTYIKEGYHLKIATVKDENEPQKKYAWEDLGWVNKDDLDQRFSIVTSMEKGAISRPIKADDKYQVVMVVEKRDQRKKTLKECYIDIEKQLYREKKEKYLKTIEKEILTKATIVYPE
jgi:peptidyl-prolyl cis-trans isomerase C